MPDQGIHRRAVASVFFDALLRESEADDEARAVQELWHFGREESAADSFWRLEGIPQVDPA